MIAFQSGLSMYKDPSFHNAFFCILETPLLLLEAGHIPIKDTVSEHCLHDVIIMIA